MTATWLTAEPTDLELAIREFKVALPGWWFTVGECSISCDASCGPDLTGPDKALLKCPSTTIFDDGFHVDLAQPATLANALRHVTAAALVARKKYTV